MAQVEAPAAAESQNPLVPAEVKAEFDLDLHCFHCNAKFGYIFTARHHCRNCGASVCWNHSVLNDKGERDSRQCIAEFKDICEKNRILWENRVDLRAQSLAAIKKTAEDAKKPKEVEKESVSMMVRDVSAAGAESPVPDVPPSAVPALLAPLPKDKK